MLLQFTFLLFKHLPLKLNDSLNFILLDIQGLYTNKPFAVYDELDHTQQG